MAKGNGTKRVIEEDEEVYSSEGNDQDYEEEDEGDFNEDNEDDWDAEAKALKMAMDEGVFDKIGMDEEGDEFEQEEGSDDDEDEDEVDGASDVGAEEQSTNSKQPIELITKPIFPNNQKALLQIHAQMTIRNLPWPERLDITSKSSIVQTVPDVNDDLKRETSFYNMALQAVKVGKIRFREAGMGFTRPVDFFGEMLKTDNQMGKVKDRLIFEGKKMSAFESRKANKEGKLRAKETQDNKKREKAKMKKDNIKDVEKWADEAKKGRLDGIKDDDDAKRMEKIGFNGKRENANKKFGHGGSSGKFKQNDKKDRNDFSSYNPKGGDFAGGKKSNRSDGRQTVGGVAKKGSRGGAGGDRSGKRARDSKRQKAN